MHIIVFTPEVSSTLGGQPLSTFEICQHLANQGHNITLLYIKGGDLKSKYENFCTQVIKVPIWDITPSKIHKQLIPLIMSSLHIFRRISGIKSECKVMYTDTHKCCLFLLYISTLNRCKTIFHIRQPILEKIPRKYGFAIRRIDRFITVSDAIKESWMTQKDLRLTNPKKFSVIHNGVDLERFKPLEDESLRQSLKKQILNLNPEIKIISYVGRLDEYKGILTLLEAFQAVCKNAKFPLKLVLAGRSVMPSTDRSTRSYAEIVKEWVCKNRLENKVIFTGHLTDPLALYQISDMTVLPSLYPEPFGRAIIESMACGVPVVASNVGGIPEILTQEFAQYLFQPGDAVTLADRLRSLLDWRSHNPELGRRCCQHVSINFSLPHTLTQVENILKKFSTP